MHCHPTNTTPFKREQNCAKVVEDLVIASNIWFQLFKILVLNCDEFVMEVMLKKSLVLETKKTQNNETFMASKYNLNAHFSVFWFH